MGFVRGTDADNWKNKKQDVLIKLFLRQFYAVLHIDRLSADAARVSQQIDILQHARRGAESSFISPSIPRARFLFEEHDVADMLMFRGQTLSQLSAASSMAESLIHSLR